MNWDCIFHVEDDVSNLLIIRGSFQKFCTLYVFSLKMNLFYKIHLETFNVISICFITAVQRLGKSCIPIRTPSLLMRLITRVTSLDTSSIFLKCFSRSSFFNFGNKSKSSGLMPELYGGWRSTCHPYFSKISDTAPEAWGRALSCTMRTPAANMEPTLQRLFSSAKFESRFWKQKRLTYLLHAQFLHMICVDLLPTGYWR